MISILALVLLALFAALAISYAGMTNMTLQQADNQANVQSSLMAAESGMSFYLYVLKNASIPGKPTDQALLDALNTCLRAQAMVTGNVGAGGVTYDGTTIRLASVATPSGATFSGAILRKSSTAVTLRVTGQTGAVTRSVSMDFNLQTGHSAVLDFGIATKSPIMLTGNDSIRGANQADEGNILSATYSVLTAVSMTGNAKIGGDVSISNPSGQVSLTGNVSVGGASGAAAADHIHIGVGQMDFPEIDPSVFAPFATNIVDGSTSTNGNKTFTNIRIRAGTNPTFSGNITLKGVVYVEKPNRVSFAGNLNFTGVLVTEDAGDNAYDDNTIRFTGNTTSQGVESLPDTPEFHTLRQRPGSFLLAPGFGVSFTGNFGTVNGAMAADKFNFTGNAGGTVYGPVINYSDSEFRMTGNASLIINRSRYTGTPPGFNVPSKFSPDPGSYMENPR